MFITAPVHAVQQAQAEVLPPTYPKMTNAIADDMTGTFAFYLNQNLSIQYLARRFPELQTELARARDAFDRRFRPSINAIDAILAKENTRWQSDKPQFVEALRERIELQVGSVTDDQARTFVAELEARSQGDIPSPFIETLLIYHPDMLKQPIEEFIRGYRHILTTADHPKGKGLSVEVEVPRSWQTREGRRPNIVYSVFSENGRGLEGITLGVWAGPEVEQLARAYANDLLSESFMKEWLPRGAIYRSSERIALDGVPGRSLEYDHRITSVDQEIASRNIDFIILFKDRLLNIHCAVAHAEDNPRTLDQHFALFEGLFRLIANSLVIQDRWGGL